MFKPPSSDAVERARLKVQRADARQRQLGLRLDRAFYEYRKARSEYEDAMIGYVAALEEMAKPS